MFDPRIPLYLSIIFLIVITVPIFMIAHLARKNSRSSKAKVNYWGILLFYFTYLAFVSYACLNGYFVGASLPPRIILITTLPLLTFLIGYIFQTKDYNSIIDATPLDEMVRLHIFRLIGSFFLILLFLELLPQSIGLLAGCGDLITAISSLFVARAVKKGKAYSKKLVLIWNTFGFIDILITSATAIILTKLSINTGSQGVEILAKFPFCFIPAFAPATIIFLHFSIYKKLLRK